MWLTALPCSLCYFFLGVYGNCFSLHVCLNCVSHPWCSRWCHRLLSEEPTQASAVLPLYSTHAPLAFCHLMNFVLTVLHIKSYCGPPSPLGGKDVAGFTSPICLPFPSDCADRAFVTLSCSWSARLRSGWGIFDNVSLSVCVRWIQCSRCSAFEWVLLCLSLLFVQVALSHPCVYRVLLRQRVSFHRVPARPCVFVVLRHPQVSASKMSQEK